MEELSERAVLLILEKASLLFEEISDFEISSTKTYTIAEVAEFYQAQPEEIQALQLEYEEMQGDTISDRLTPRGLLRIALLGLKTEVATQIRTWAVVAIAAFKNKGKSIQELLKSEYYRQFSNREIATVVDVAESTVRYHRRHLESKGEIEPQEERTYSRGGKTYKQKATKDAKDAKEKDELLIPPETKVRVSNRHSHYPSQEGLVVDSPDGGRSYLVYFPDSNQTISLSGKDLYPIAPEELSIRQSQKAKDETIGTIVEMQTLAEAKITEKLTVLRQEVATIKQTLAQYQQNAEAFSQIRQVLHSTHREVGESLEEEVMAVAIALQEHSDLKKENEHLKQQIADLAAYRQNPQASYPSGSIKFRKNTSLERLVV